MSEPVKIKCANKRCGVKFTPERNRKDARFCCDACRVMAWREEKRAKKMTRKDMQAVAESIADIYPGKKLIVLMPGDEIPDELKP